MSQGHCWTRSAGAVTTLMALCCVGGLCSIFADEPDEHDDANGPEWTLKVPWYETAKAKDRITVKSKLSALLKQDWENQKSGAEKAGQNFEAAWKLCSTDPRLPYAYGLVLWHHGKPEEAIRRFEQAQAVDGQFFPPAFQAAAWCHFERNHLSDGLRSLRHFAERLRTEEASKLNLEYRLDLYEWLGQMYGFANRLDEAGEQRDALSAVETACRFEDDPVPAQQFEQGRQSVEPIFTKLAALAQRSEKEIRMELDPQREAVRQELDQVAAGMAEAIAELKQVKQTAREAEIRKNRGNQNLKRVTARYNELVQDGPALLTQLSTAEAVARVEMDTAFKRVAKQVKDEDATRRARDDKNSKGNETIYKTVYEHVPKSNVERAFDRQNWETARRTLQSLKDEVASMNATLETAREEAEAARTNRVEHKRETAIRSRELRGRILPQARTRRLLEQRVKQMTAWLNQPELFRAHARTIPPYVPWFAQDERDKVRQSLTPAAETK